LALGFKTNIFAPIYEQISKASLLTFKLYTWVKLLHEVEEPDNASYDSAIVFVASTLSENGYNISFDEEDTLLIVNIEEMGIKMQLPPAVNKLFGLPDDFVFHNQRTEIIRPEEPIIDVSPEPISNNVDDFIQSQFVYVMCDAIRPQVAGEKSRAIRKKDNIKKIVNLVFSPVYYMTPSCSHLTNIRLRLVDEFLIPIAVSDIPTSALLHIKTNFL
jgi:hypothetical protein